MKITKNRLIKEELKNNRREMPFIFKIKFTNYLYETTDNERSPVTAEFFNLKSEEFLNFIKSRIKINENNLYFYDVGLPDNNIFISGIIATIADVTYNYSEIIINGKGKFSIEGEPDKKAIELIEGNLEVAISDNIKIKVYNNPKYKGICSVKIKG